MKNPEFLDRTHMLVLSSLVFLTNIVSTWYTGHPIYCILFCCLTLTSIFFHSYGCLGYLDKMMILGIVVHALYLMENNAELPMILGSCLVVMILYFYGWYAGEFCFHPNDGDTWHMMLHLMSSFGHHLVVL
jgi:hypothetical protein